MRRNLRKLAPILGAVAVWAGVNAGAGYVFRRRRRRYAGARRHFLVTHGGVDVRPTGDEIRDGVVSVMMGGASLDLRGAQLVDRPARLDVLIIMGGVQIMVPDDWKVQVDVESAFGGVQDRRDGGLEPERPVDLVLSGRVALGGLEVIRKARVH